MAVSIVGVYPVPRNPDVDLVEIEIDRPPSKVDLDKFTQEDQNVDRSSWQVPYDERFLNSDGTDEISERWAVGWSARPGVKEARTTRLVFFFHFLDAKRPLVTPDGKVALPSRTKRPSRLAFLKYEPPD
jgi:hypothetical protein